MQRQHRLLLLSFHRHRAYARLLNRRPDCPRVVRVILVAAHKGTHHLRRQNANLVTQFLQVSGPVLAASAGFQCDEARDMIGESHLDCRATFDIVPMVSKANVNALVAGDRWLDQAPT